MNGFLILVALFLGCLCGFKIGQESVIDHGVRHESVKAYGKHWKVTATTWPDAPEADK